MMLRSLHIIYTSTTGHTEHVVDTLMEYVSQYAADLRVIKQRAETCTPQDLIGNSDVLLLACGTWNTDMQEGQLSPYMKKFLSDAADIDLGVKPVTAIGLGDERYHYTARAVDLLVDFLKSHHGYMFLPALAIVNDPYGQEEKVRLWVQELLGAIQKLPPVIAA